MNRLLTFMTGLALLSVVPATQAVTDTYTVSGTWTAPAGVTSVDVEAWGGGGAGGGNPTTTDGGGGGGGGAYSKTTAIPVVPGTVYTVTVGAAGIAVDLANGGAGGDSWFSTAGTLLAKGGAGGAVPLAGAGGLGGAGGAAAAGIGVTKFSGGNGGTGRNSGTGRGGPGGSSAGTALNGTSGPVVWATATATAPPAGGGIGGNGGNANRQNGFAPASGNGGGGGGGAEQNTMGGAGAPGLVNITYVPPPAVTSINRFDPDPTTLVSVRWTVIFNTSVTGVSSSNFTLVNSGLGGTPAITSVTGGGTTWTVTASTGTGTGTLGLNMTNDAGVTPALINLPFTGEIYSVRPPAPVTYFHDTTLGVNIGFDGLTNVTGVNQVIPPIITASLNPVSTCPVTSARSASHPVGLYTHSRWYLNANYAAATNIGANPNGSASLRGAAVTDTVVVSLYDYDPVPGGKTLIGSSAPITLTGGGTTTTYLYTISSALYTVPAGHRLMLEYNFNQPLATNNARVYCGVASYIAVTETAATVAPDHLVIQSTGSGLTCAANTLTIVACQDAGCATPYTGGISGTLTATGAGMTVNWDGTTGGAAGAGFAIPSGSSSVTKNVHVATAGSVVFGITSPAPVPTNATTCNFGAPACTFTADTAGFVFSDTATGGAYTIPAQVSGIATPTLYLRALQAATNNPAVCTPAIIGQTTAVNMGYVCNNPAACQAGNLATINATAVAPGGTAVSLTFDANGSASITSRYDDVGQITLNANKTVTPFGGATAVTLNGSSNAFVVKPDHFDLSGIQQTAAPNLANPAAADATGAKFVKAGEQFSVTVTAKNALGATTANYGQETTAESVKLTSALAGGLGLTDNPAIGGTFGAFAGGVATGTAFTWNEAGIITLTPSVADADYLGAGDATGTTSGNVGRFYAAQFALSGGVIANRTGLAGCAAPAGCGAFTYMGEQMSAVFALIAKAVDGATTLQNYNYSATAANNFAKLDPMAIGNPLVLGAVDTGAPRTVATLDTTTYGVASGSFASGIASVVAPFAVTRGGSASGPFDALDVGVNPADGDGAVLAVLDLAVNAGGTPNTHGLVASTKARYGRMKLSNAHGSELLPLMINVATQYWNGATYVTNILDNNSTFAATDVIFGNYTKNLNAANYPNSGATAVTPASVVFVNGATSYRLAKAGAGNNGSVDMTVSAISAYLPSNTARATFGVYKGNNEFIYLRETY